MPCTIKIFWGSDNGGDTFKIPSPDEQFIPLPTHCFKVFLERSLNHNRTGGTDAAPFRLLNAALERLRQSN